MSLDRSEALPRGASGKLHKRELRDNGQFANDKSTDEPHADRDQWIPPVPTEEEVTRAHTHIGGSALGCPARIFGEGEPEHQPTTATEKFFHDEKKLFVNLIEAVL